MGGGANPNFVLHILSNLVNVRMHTENWLCNLPGGGSLAWKCLKSSCGWVGGGGGGYRVNIVLVFGIALA